MDPSTQPPESFTVPAPEILPDEPPTSDELESHRQAVAEAGARLEQLEGELKGVTTPVSVKVESQPFGDNSYVIRQSGIIGAGGMRQSLMTGFLRNGRAVVEIQFSGNFPLDVMDQEMVHFLRVMHEKTDVYGSLGD